jgi:hypothetical protein
MMKLMLPNENEFFENVVLNPFGEETCAKAAHCVMRKRLPPKAPGQTRYSLYIDGVSAPTDRVQKNGIVPDAAWKQFQTQQCDLED